MRQLITIVACLLNWVSLMGQNKSIICGTYKSDNKIIFHIYEPMNGYYNMSFVDLKKENSLIIPNSDSFYFSTSQNSPATYLVYITTDEKVFLAKSVILMFPGDSIHMSIDLLVENQDVINYKGSNCTGQKLFNSINYDPVYKYKPLIDKMNQLKPNQNNFEIFIDNHITNLCKGFDSLLNINLISPEFYSYIKTTFSQLSYSFVAHKFLLNYKQREIFKKQERDSLLEHFFIRQPVNDPYLKSSYNSYFYQMDYFNFLTYKKNNLLSIEPLYKEVKFTNKGKDYFIGNECGQFLYINNKETREALWAIILLDMLKMAPPESVSESITQFKEIFDDGIWNKFFDKQMFDAGQETEIKYELSTPVIFIDSTNNISSLEKLLAELPKGKSILLDLWASWCAPCIKAFQFNKQLDTFLLSKNIQRLYVSLDNKGTENKWKLAVNKYALGGFHIIANDSLIADIKEICKVGKENPISIPRYLLIDKNHKVRLDNAMTPENIHQLKEEIETHLLK